MRVAVRVNACCLHIIKVLVARDRSGAERAPSAIALASASACPIFIRVFTR